MTETAIKEQIKAIERATEKAMKSKETALKFLQDAGIIKTHAAAQTNNSSKKKK